MTITIKALVSVTVFLLAIPAVAVGQGIKPPSPPTPKPFDPSRTAVPRKTVVPKGTPSPRVTAVPRASGAVELRSDRMGYDWWGRPEAMDKADGKCANLDDSRRTLRLEASFQIVNKSKQRLTPADYWVQFYRSDGKLALTCFWLYEGASSAPNIEPGQTVNITFMSFVEPNERVGYAQLITKPFGRGNRVVVPKNLNIP